MHSAHVENSKNSIEPAARRNARRHHASVRRVLLIDNYDSFTYNLVHLLEQCGARCTVFQSDAIAPADVRALQPDGLLLCPGPAGPDRAGVTLKLVEEFAGRIPLLGVCLGHQAIGQSFGARVRPASRLLHGKTSPILHGGEGLYRGIPSPFTAARYHSLVVDESSLPSAFEVTAWTAEGELMGIRLREAPVDGVQFHPESFLSDHGTDLISNWLEAL